MQKHASLLTNIALPVLAVMAMNALIFGLGWNAQPPQPVSWFNPPGALIGAVWLLLFILMGIARYHVQKSGHVHAVKFARVIVYYMVFCLSYPLYTQGLNNDVMGYIGNAATMMVAAYLVITLYPISRTAAWCIFPALPWIAYATLTMLL